VWVKIVCKSCIIFVREPSLYMYVVNKRVTILRSTISNTTSPSFHGSFTTSRSVPARLIQTKHLVRGLNRYCPVETSGLPPLCLHIRLTICYALLRRQAHQQEENEDEILGNSFFYDSRKSCSTYLYCSVAPIDGSCFDNDRDLIALKMLEETSSERFRSFQPSHVDQSEHPNAS
jgi:hypothetical protein